MSSMKAVRIHEYGGPDVLNYETVPRPEPGDGEVLVRVFGAGVNPLDWKARSGALRSAIPYELPLIPGWDLAGTVERLGPRNNGFAVDEPVYTRADTSRNGAYAEYVVIRTSDLARKPPSLDYVEAAAVPVAALTAWQALFESDMINLAAGQRVLIHGASGGVGTFAVQLARWKQAEVIATGSTSKGKILRDLGADTFIDYTKERFEEVVHGVDAVLDLVGGETQRRSWDVLNPSGVLVTTVGLSAPENALAQGVRAAQVNVKTKVEQLDTIGRLIEQGLVRPVVSEVFPLPAARRAHELGEKGHLLGKMVLKVG